jgi:hypothetical protein
MNIKSPSRHVREVICCAGSGGQIQAGAHIDSAEQQPRGNHSAFATSAKTSQSLASHCMRPWLTVLFDTYVRLSHGFVIVADKELQRRIAASTHRAIGVVTSGLTQTGRSVTGEVEK